MLVLSRKAGEKIVVNGDIVLTIIKIDRHQVRLGIDAPQSVPVYRQELLTPAMVSPQLPLTQDVELGMGSEARTFADSSLDAKRTHSRSHAHAHSDPHPRGLSKPNPKLPRFCSTSR